MNYRSAFTFTNLEASYSLPFPCVGGPHPNHQYPIEHYTATTPTLSYPSSFGSCSWDTTTKCYYLNFFVDNGFWNGGNRNTSLSGCIPLYNHNEEIFGSYAYDGVNVFVNILDNDYAQNFIQNNWVLYIVIYFNACNAASGNLNVYVYNPVLSTLPYYFYSYYYRQSGNTFTQHNGGTLLQLSSTELASWYATGGSCEFYQTTSSPGTPWTTGDMPCCDSIECSKNP